MIIDTHMHIGTSLDFDMTEEQILYSMERYKIDFALVSNTEGVEFDHMGTEIPDEFQKSQYDINKRAIDFSKSYPDKIGALLWIKMYNEYPDEHFLRLIRQNRDFIYGIKLHPFHSRVSPDDARMEAWYDVCRKNNLPVVSHTGGCEKAMSRHMYNAAKLHPDINFVMVHMDLGTDNEEAINFICKQPNLYGDTTWVSIESTIKAIKRCGSEKILFGSDNPIDGKDTFLHNKSGDRSLYQQYFNELKNLIDNKDYENIMYKNAQRLFML